MEDKFGTYTEERIVDPTNVLLCFLLAVAVVLFIIGSIKTFDMDHYDSIVLSVSTVFVYGLVVYVLLRPKIVRRGIETKIERVEVVKTVEKQPIVHRIEAPIVTPIVVEEPIKPIEEIKPVEEPKIIEPVIEKQIEEPKPVEPRVIIKTIEKPVLSHITIESPRKSLNIPKYDYRGSSETKIYHKATCRLSKSIKNKYKVSANDANYFVKRGYTACKNCIDKQKKENKESNVKAEKIVVEKKPVKLLNVKSPATAEKKITTVSKTSTTKPVISKLPTLKEKTAVKTTHIKTTKTSDSPSSADKKKVVTTKIVEKKVVVGKK